LFPSPGDAGSYDQRLVKTKKAAVITHRRRKKSSPDLDQATALCTFE
jgi:hypothetical protein